MQWDDCELWGNKSKASSSSYVCHSSSSLALICFRSFNCNWLTSHPITSRELWFETLPTVVQMGTPLPEEAHSLLPCSGMNNRISYQFSTHENVPELTVSVRNEGRSVVLECSFWSGKLAKNNGCSALQENFHSDTAEGLISVFSKRRHLIINPIYWIHNFTSHWHMLFNDILQLRVLFPKCCLLFWMCK